jgi:transposase
MVQPLSLDIRERMAKAVDAGASRNSVAKRFDVAASTVIKLMQHAKATGSLKPKKIGGYCKHKLAGHDGAVRELLRATPDATLDELVGALGKRGIKASRSGLDRYLGHIGLSFKKNSARRRAGQGRRGAGA